MNRVTSTERKKPAVKQASYVNRYCLTGDRIRTVSKLSHLIPSKVNSKLRVRSNYPIPSSGKPTAERICVDNSLALDFKKRWVLLKKGTTPVQQSCGDRRVACLQVKGTEYLSGSTYHREKGGEMPNFRGLYA